MSHYECGACGHVRCTCPPKPEQPTIAHKSKGKTWKDPVPEMGRAISAMKFGGQPKQKSLVDRIEEIREECRQRGWQGAAEHLYMAKEQVIWAQEGELKHPEQRTNEPLEYWELKCLEALSLDQFQSASNVCDHLSTVDAAVKDEVLIEAWLYNLVKKGHAQRTWRGSTAIYRRKSATR